MKEEVIIESYSKAKASGDRNVYFVHEETLFEGDCYESCTSNGCHPNELGVCRMTKKWCCYCIGAEYRVKFI